MAENAQSTVDSPDSFSTERKCYCPLDGMMSLLSRKYAMQVVCAIGLLGPARYGEIEAAFGEVSSATLSTRLGELMGAELLTRERYAEIPPRVEYALTDDGEELCELLEPLLRWSKIGTVAAMVENRNDE